MKHIKILWLFVLAFTVLQAVIAGETAGSLPAAAASPPPASFQVRNKKYGELLRPRDANNANGTPLVLYPAQPWKCMTWKFHPAGDSTFQLQNHFTSKTFAAVEAGQAQPSVSQLPFAKEPAARPAWKFSKLGNGAYRITDAKSGKALAAVKDDTGLRVVEQTWQDTDEQKWELLPIDPKELTM